MTVSDSLNKKRMKKGERGRGWARHKKELSFFSVRALTTMEVCGSSFFVFRFLSLARSHFVKKKKRKRLPNKNK